MKNVFHTGAQCNEQIVENIRWTRTPAKNTISVKCPRDVLSNDFDVNSTGLELFPVMQKKCVFFFVLKLTLSTLIS